MPRVRIGVVVYREKDENGVWYIAVEPLSGAQAQGESIEEAVERLKEEVRKMSSAWCESEVREAIDARLVEVELPEGSVEYE